MKAPVLKIDGNEYEIMRPTMKMGLYRDWETDRKSVV